MSVLSHPLGREASRQVLEALERAPLPVAELPRRWPVTRTLVRACVAELEARGELRIERAGGRQYAARKET